MYTINEIDQYIADTEANWGSPVVGVVVAGNGEIMDGCFNWETCENYANDGYKVIIVKGDGGKTKSYIQYLCDTLRDNYIDCFGGSN